MDRARGRALVVVAGGGAGLFAAGWRLARRGRAGASERDMAGLAAYVTAVGRALEAHGFSVFSTSVISDDEGGRAKLRPEPGGAPFPGKLQALWDEGSGWQVYIRRDWPPGAPYRPVYYLSSHDLGVRADPADVARILSGLMARSKIRPATGQPALRKRLPGLLPPIPGRPDSLAAAGL